MKPEAIKEQYDMLYEYMASSRNPENMKTFGHVMSEMMDYLIQNKPDVAEEMVQKLESVKWKQYLTPREADAIISKMQPKAPWPDDKAWTAAMESLGFLTEEAPYYNSCALWTEMNKQHSDHAETLAAKVFRKPLSAIPNEEIVPVIYGLAMDVLRDKDDVYCIRRYFGM